MADPAGYEIVTYQRQPGIWRASVTPKGSATSGLTVRSVVTPDDWTSEDEARKAAIRVIKNIDTK
jgi:hypothetical protein